MDSAGEGEGGGCVKEKFDRTEAFRVVPSWCHRMRWKALLLLPMDLQLNCGAAESPTLEIRDPSLSFGMCAAEQ